MTETKDNSEISLPPDASFGAEGAERLSGSVFLTLCAILVFSTVAFGAVDTWALGFLCIGAAFIVFLVFWGAWKTRRLIFSDDLLQLPLVGLILIGVIQLLPLRSADVSGQLLSVPAVSSLSLAPYATRLAVIQLIVYLVFFAAALLVIDNRERLKKTVLLIVVFGSVMAFFGILQRLSNPEAIYGVRPTLQAIPFASFVNQHHFAAFMEMTIALPLALFFGNATKRDKRLLLIIAAVLMGVAVIFTSSRGGFLSLLGVLGFIIAANMLGKSDHKGEAESADVEKAGKYRRNFALIGGGIALILVLIGLVLLLGGDQSLLRGTGLTSSSADLTGGRFHFWEVALKVFRDHPLIGSGLDSFGTVFPHYDSWNGQFRVEQAHNDYLQILSDGGIPAFLSVLAFIFLLFKRSLRVIGESENRFRRSTAIGALAGCFGVLLHSFFDFPLRTPSNGFFFLTLTVLATASIHYPVRHRRRRRRSAKDDETEGED
ncbi:MAG: O-antigen ligase family protein [Pyrinomonadaceae bacterium]